MKTQKELIKELSHVQGKLSSLRHKKEKLEKRHDTRIKSINGQRRELRERRKDIMARLAR